MVGYALYVQHHLFMMPCPLCILQRVGFLLAGSWLALGVIVGGQWRWVQRLVATAAAISALAGAGVAGWHLRMQYAPSDNLPSCGSMELSYMLEAFPLKKVAEKVFAGSAECAKIDWTFLGLSMPGWAFIGFIGVAAWSLWAGWRIGAERKL